MTTPLLATDKLSAMYGKFTAVKNVSLTFAPNRVHALIGPSGCGKSTFLRSLNRMHENTPGAWIVGRVLLEGADVYAPEVSPMRLRRRVGMVFQKPTPFPTMSIFDNVAAGLRLDRGRSRTEVAEIVAATSSASKTGTSSGCQEPSKSRTKTGPDGAPSRRG